LDVGPRHQFIELAREMAVDDFGENVSHVSLRIDAIEFAGLDERRDDRPVLAAAVRAGKESVLSVECAMGRIPRSMTLESISMHASST
jgi:hypothetical protein